MTKTPVNNPNRKGQLAGAKELFGECSRYAVAPVHTRFDAVAWFVWDGETRDPATDLPMVIRQADTKEEAMRGLTDEGEV